MGDGRLLAILAAFCFALAATLQQRGQFRLAREGHPVQGVKDLFRLLVVWVWLLGTAVLFAGYALQAVALSIGKMVVIQPLLVTTLVFALPLGHWLSNQHVTRTQVSGAVVVVVGLALFIWIGDPSAGVDTAPNWQVALTALAVLAISAVLVLISRSRAPTQRAALLGAAAGLLFGLSATFDKPLFSATDSLGGMLTSWELYALVGFGLVAFFVQQMSLSTGQLAPAMAAVAVCNPVASCGIGALVYQEQLTSPGWHIFLALVALLAAFAGAIAVTIGNWEIPIPGMKTAVALGESIEDSMMRGAELATRGVPKGPLKRDGS